VVGSEQLGHRGGEREREAEFGQQGFREDHAHNAVRDPMLAAALRQAGGFGVEAKGVDLLPALGPLNLENGAGLAQVVEPDEEGREFLRIFKIIQVVIFGVRR